MELERFQSLPDEAVISSKLAAIILDLSERTTRYHPHLKRIWISEGRYGFQVGQVRRLAREGMPLDDGRAA
jgi:hypothetical protein